MVSQVSCSIRRNCDELGENTALTINKSFRCAVKYIHYQRLSLCERHVVYWARAGVCGFLEKGT